MNPLDVVFSSIDSLVHSSMPALRVSFAPTLARSSPTATHRIRTAATATTPTTTNNTSASTARRHWPLSKASWTVVAVALPPPPPLPARAPPLPRPLPALRPAAQLSGPSAVARDGLAPPAAPQARASTPTTGTLSAFSRGGGMGMSGDGRNYASGVTPLYFQS